MTDSPTDRLGLRRMSLGSNRNTWGDPKQNEMLDAIDQAVAGIADIPCTGTEVTLDATLYAENQARSAALRFIGSPGGDVTVTVPASEKIWDVMNELTGGYAVILTTEAGDDLTIPNGAYWRVGTDGADVFQISSPLVILHGTADYDTGTLTLDLRTGEIFTHTCTEDTEIVLAGALAYGDSLYFLRLTNGGAHVITWPANTEWEGRTAPILTVSGIDEIVFRRTASGSLVTAVARLDLGPDGS